MKYLKPPIIEAACQLSYASAIDYKLVQKVQTKVGRKYPSKKDRNDVTAMIDAVTGAVSNAAAIPTGFEFRDESETQVLIVDRQQVLLGQLAPYPGWEEFEGRILRDVETVRGVVGPLQISRIGLRYINRIDVPIEEDGLSYGERYVRVEPSSFDYGSENYVRYIVQFTKQLADDGYLYNLSCATVDSPVPLHSSVLLDIDVYWLGSSPFRRDVISSVVRKLRMYKNEVFESAITDEARAVFGIDT